MVGLVWEDGRSDYNGRVSVGRGAKDALGAFANTLHALLDGWFHVMGDPAFEVRSQRGDFSVRLRRSRGTTFQPFQAVTERTEIGGDRKEIIPNLLNLSRKILNAPIFDDWCQGGTAGRKHSSRRCQRSLSNHGRARPCRYRGEDELRWVRLRDRRRCK